jgi:uncharacterized tellurite resistance protein B-like protein
MTASSGGSPSAGEGLARLDRDAKIRLAGLVCHFAWADLSVQGSERSFVKRLVTELALGPSDAARVESWLASPPPLEYLKVDTVPEAHRRLFCDMAERVVYADGRMDAREESALRRLQKTLLGIEPPPKRR